MRVARTQREWNPIELTTGRIRLPGKLIPVALLAMHAGCFQPALPREVDGDDVDGDGDAIAVTEIDGTDGAEVDDAVEVEVGAEVDVEPSLQAPAGFTASLDRNQDVELVWGAVEGAEGYRVVRCRLVAGVCGEDAPIGAVGSEATRFLDTTAEVQGLPAAPTVEASRTLAERVEVSWGEAVVPLAPRYRYRVVAFDERGEGPPAEAVGGRAERPVTGYGVAVGDGAFVAADGRGWSDEEAPAPTLSVGEVSASLGTYAELVRVSALPPSAQPGDEREYRVRAVTDYGNGAVGVGSGRRVAGDVRLQWERSVGTSAEGFEALSGAVGLSFDDAGAPADGAVRWYRLRVEADGAETVWSDAVVGARQPPPGVPGQVRATSDLSAEVKVVWSPVSGALGYHVYRDGVKLTTGQGVVATEYRDTSAPAAAGSWAAPVIGTATSNQTERVTVTWTAPSRPLAPVASYVVRAVNAAGEGDESSAAEGRRAGPALLGYEVEWMVGGAATWVGTGGVGTTWHHATAPAGVITGGQITVSQGAHRASVKLAQAGATTAQGALVTYRVRGVLEGGAVTPASEARSGRRTVGSLSTTWQRSSGTTATTFATIPGGVAVATYDDTAAPSSGEKRWYQALLIASGAEQRVVGPLEGWRLAFVMVDGGGGEYGNTCALTPQGTYWCWGEVWSPMMGVPFVPDRGLEPLAGAMPAGVQFGSLWGTREPMEQGHMFNCALGGGDIYCWGDNNLGALGDGTFTARETPVRVVGLSAAAIAFGVGVGGAHACAVVDNTGRVQCWGKNSDYQLGRGTTQSKSPTPVTVSLSTGSDLTSAVEVKAGGLHSCARRAGGTVACWGRNQFGQLGSSALNDVKVDTVAGLTGVVELSLGLNHGCARLQGGTVKCWGAGYGGVLGDGFTQNRTSPVSVIGVSNAVQVNGNCARRNDGSVLCWGGEFGATPVLWQGLSGATWVGSANHWAGDARCVIVDGGVRCWRRPSEAQYEVSLP